MAKKLSRIINDVRKQLTWQVLHGAHNAPLDIISDSVARTHTIRFPTNPGPDNPIREIEYLHELAHAYLAEREPVFCVHEIVTHSCIAIAEALKAVSDPIRATGDWFVDDLVMQRAPKEQREFFMEHVELFRRALARDPNQPDELILPMGHIFAQGVYYLKAKFPVPSAIREIMDTFLSVSPGKPTQANFSKLFNALLARVGVTAAWSERECAWIIERYKNLDTQNF